jgi:succinate dehydrogenase cytochrome b556 subunit
MGKIPDIPAAVAAVKNPASKIVYDDRHHELYPPGNPSKRAFSSLRDPQDDSARVDTMNILRPLSPHLPIYKPQLTSTFSIFHRITGAFLSTMVLGFYLVCLKAGLICFTFESFYQFLFSSSKLILLSLEISTLALSYHLFHGVRHLLTDFSGNLFLGRKRFK